MLSYSCSPLIFTGRLQLLLLERIRRARRNRYNHDDDDDGDRDDADDHDDHDHDHDDHDDNPHPIRFRGQWPHWWVVVVTFSGERLTSREIEKLPASNRSDRKLPQSWQKWKSNSITSFQINNSDACLVIWDHKIWFGFLFGTKSEFYQDLSNWIFNGCDNMFLWYLLAGRIMGPPGKVKVTRWPPDKVAKWPGGNVYLWCLLASASQWLVAEVRYNKYVTICKENISLKKIIAFDFLNRRDIRFRIFIFSSPVICLSIL